MARLINITYYQQYLRLGEDNGALRFPAFEVENGAIKINYGEVYCRHADCMIDRHRYTTTNALRKHVMRHGAVVSEGTSGRPPQKVLNNALAFYKQFVLDRFEERSREEQGELNAGTARRRNVPKPSRARARAGDERRREDLGQSSGGAPQHSNVPKPSKVQVNVENERSRGGLGQLNAGTGRRRSTPKPSRVQVKVEEEE